MRHCTVQLDLFHQLPGTMFYPRNSVFIVSPLSLHLQRSLRHDMTNTDFYTTALHGINVRLAILRHRQQQHATNFNDRQIAQCSFATCNYFQKFLVQRALKRDVSWVTVKEASVQNSQYRISGVSVCVCVCVCGHYLPCHRIS